MDIIIFVITIFHLYVFTNTFYLFLFSDDFMC